MQSKSPAGKPRSIDEYLAPLSAEKRAALQKLRRAIKAAAPGAEECISYDMPCFRLEGRMLVGFAAWANHCAFYAGSAPMAACKKELEAYDISKGAIRFRADRPLPAALVRKLIGVQAAARSGPRKRAR